MKIAIVNLLPDSGHVIPLLKIAQTLNNNGIDVKYYGPSETQKLANDYKIKSIFLGEMRPANYQTILDRFSKTTPFFKHILMAKWFYINYFEKVMFNGMKKTDELVLLLQNDLPDLMLCDNHLFLSTYKKLAKQLDIPLVLNDAAGSYFNYQNPILQHTDFGSFGNKLAKNLKPLLGRAYALSMRLFFPKISAKNESISRYISNYWEKCSSENVDSIKTLNISLGAGAIEKKYLVNRISIPDNIIQLGPLPLIPNGELSDDLKNWLDDATLPPVIYIGFGTMIRGNFSFAQAIINAAEKHSFRILWSHPQKPWKDDIEQPCHARWEQWVPQTKILAHPNIKLFITHGGSGAIQEALWFSKPTICIPFLWDQPYNAWVMEQLGCGISINKSKITPESMYHDISKALNLLSQTEKIGNEFKSVSCSYEKLIHCLQQYRQ